MRTRSALGALGVLFVALSGCSTELEGVASPAVVVDPAYAGTLCSAFAPELAAPFFPGEALTVERADESACSYVAEDGRSTVSMGIAPQDCYAAQALYESDETRWGGPFEDDSGEVSCSWDMEIEPSVYQTHLIWRHDDGRWFECRIEEPNDHGREDDCWLAYEAVDARL